MSTNTINYGQSTVSPSCTFMPYFRYYHEYHDIYTACIIMVINDREDFAEHTNTMDRDGYFRCAVRYISSVLEISPSIVGKRIQMLKEKGAIFVKQRKDGNWLKINRAHNESLQNDYDYKVEHAKDVDAEVSEKIVYSDSLEF